MARDRTGHETSAEHESNHPAWATTHRTSLVFARSYDRTSLVQSLWLDAQTGLTIKRQDKVGGEVIYERMLTKIESNPDLPTTVFGLPENATIVKGLVSANILTETRKSVADFQTEMNSMRSSSILQHGGWISL